MTFSTKSPQITLWSVSMSVAKLALSGSTAHLSPAQVLVQVDRWGEHNVQCATLPLVTSYEIHQTLFCQFLKYTPTVPISHSFLSNIQSINSIAGTLLSEIQCCQNG